MAKRTNAVAETQLKRRRTSLGNKSKEDLINIILRKDKVERNSSDKIRYLNDKIKSLNDEYKSNIEAADKRIKEVNNEKTKLSNQLNNSESVFNLKIDSIKKKRNIYMMLFAISLLINIVILLVKVM